MGLILLRSAGTRSAAGSRTRSEASTGPAVNGGPAENARVRRWRGHRPPATLPKRAPGPGEPHRSHAWSFRCYALNGCGRDGACTIVPALIIGCAAGRKK